VTEQSWTKRWFHWLLLVFISWFGLEGWSIIQDHAYGDVNIYTWTLSETIRRWAIAYDWLAPVSIGTASFLTAHFFLEKNPK
jgi:hypothetical protein